MIGFINRILPGRTLPAGDPSKFVLWRWMDIVIEDELYLRRLYIFRMPWLGLMLHQIKGPDDARDGLHSHPWKLGPFSFFAVVLAGGYREDYAEIPDSKHHLLNVKSRVRRRFRPFVFKSNEVHAIREVDAGTVTLCLALPRHSGWGFWVTGKGIVPWQEHLDGAR